MPYLHQLAVCPGKTVKITVMALALAKRHMYVE
jgi:hypothetical protein